MIDALVSGRLVGRPTQRIAKNGSPYAIAKLRASARDGESLFLNLIAFNATTIAALLALEDRDVAAVAGELTATAYIDKNGQPRPSIDLLVHSILSEYHVARKRQAVKTAKAAAPEPEAPSDQQPAQAEVGFDDPIPF